MKSLARTLASAAFVAALALYGTTASAQAPVKVAGNMLTNDAGMTLYTFDKDAGGKSACNGPCATSWPPVPADAAPVSAPFSIVTREDGTKQIAYKGKPLYLYAADKKPGERTGDGFKDLWHVVKD